MTENFILSFIPQRMKQLGYQNWHVRYRDLTLTAGTRVIIPAHNELWFIVDNPVGIIVDSDYGIYDSTGDSTNENAHQHKGEIVVANPDTENRKATFIQTIIVN